MKKKMILSFLCIACLSLVFLGRQFVQSSHHRLEKFHMSKSEEENLRAFFDYHFLLSDFAYTLFGSKPLSIGRLLPTPEAGQAWATWEKLSDRLHCDTFIIRKYSVGAFEFVLVTNLKSLEEVFDANKASFVEVFGEAFSFDALVECLKYDGPIFQKLMQNHYLLGVLLGYGSQNAALFAKNQELSIQERVELQPSVKKNHPIFYLFSKVMPVSFACDFSLEETQLLVDRYARERQMIVKMGRKEILFNLMIDLLDRE